MFKVLLENYDFLKYKQVLETYKCTNNFYPQRPTLISSEFYSELLKLSKNRCYICGYTLENNHENTVYMEREHLINKNIDNEINEALLKCKNNLVPICKTCNSQKITIPMSDELKDLLKELEKNCEKDQSKCGFSCVLEKFKKENFDYNNSSINYSEQKIVFDLLLKIFFGDESYINQFSLNTRTDRLLENIINLTYGIQFNNFKDVENHLKNFAMSTIDERFIEWLIGKKMFDKDKIKLRNNLIETIVLLENI